MRTILCMLLLWQTCAPLCMPRPISLPFFTFSLLWQTCVSLCMPRQIGLPISLPCSSDRHARPSACSIRLVCRISLHRSFDWRSRYLHVLAADLRLFYSHETLTLPLLCPNGSCACTRHDTNPPWYKLKASCCKEGIPKRFCNDDIMVWIFLRCKTETQKFMCGRLPGKE